MFNFARLAKAPPAAKPILTLFHNPSSSLSNHLLHRLAKPTSRYILDVRHNKLPLYQTYKFVHEECMNVHPQNARGFEHVFPAFLRSTGHTFCNAQVKRQAKQKQFVGDIDSVSEEEYIDKVKGATESLLVPFVVDWENKLVAVDDDGLDKIMANYYSCGTQNSSITYSPDRPGLIGNRGDTWKNQQQYGSNHQMSHDMLHLSHQLGASPQMLAAAMMCAVHPHVAEFADLF